MLKIASFSLFLLFGWYALHPDLPYQKTTSNSKPVWNVMVSDTLSWKLLGLIQFVKKPHKDYGEVLFPVVNAKLKGLHKKKIVMSGFIVPIDNTNYALSKNVFASCFFCGKAGPETIIGLHFKNLKGRLKTDQYVTIEGILRVNEGNVDDWIYNLEEAVIVKGN